MPVTPFHLGPGALIKSIARHRFSFTVFVFTQVVIDTEPGYYLFHGQWPLHRFFHTLPGATLIALIVTIIGRPVCEWTIRAWNRHLSPQLQGWLNFKSKISVGCALVSSFLGTYSHVLLDGFVHSDLAPFKPLSMVNPFFRLFSVNQIHMFCIFSALAALLIFLVTALRQTQKTES